MKLKSILILAIASSCILAFSCKTEPAAPKEYIVEGTADTTKNGEMVYLTDWGLRKKLDSVTLENGTFTFKGAFDTVRYCHISIGRSYTDFILEGGNIKIDLQERTVSGTPLNEAFRQYRQQIDSLGKVQDETYKKLSEEIEDKKLVSEKMMELYNNEWRPMYHKINDNTFEANTNNIIGALIAKELSYGATTGKMDTLLNKLNKDILDGPLVKPLVERNEILKKTAESQKFTDFTITQEDGSKVSFSDYVGKGKYVLVDFWASWCGPCRAEGPNLKELYKKYKGDKFEILGVAVWDELEKTKEAIKEDKMDWPQIMDAKEIPTKLYGIQGIPHIMLIGPDGTIIARNLRGEKMKEKVAEELSK